MDFDKLNTKADAEAGALLHYLHPQLRHPLYTGEGADEFGRLVDPSKDHTAVEGLIRGTESDIVRAAASRTGARMMRGDGDGEEFEFAINLIVELRGIQRNGKTVVNSREDIIWFFRRSEDFALQTINFAKDRANFFGAASRSSGSNQGN